MAAPPDAQRRLPSQEHLLLDYMHRLEKHRRGRKAVHLHLSGLRPFNRREQHLRAAVQNFEPMVKTLNGQVFSLRNSDLFFAYKAEVHPQVETSVQKIRYLFSDDPLVAEEAAQGREFATWYDAESQFDEILHAVRSMAEAEEARVNEEKTRHDSRAKLRARQEQGEPLTPEVLARIEDALSRSDLSNLVRRQFICAVDAKMVPTQEFSELFISIKDLRETLLPGVNLLSNRWLFQHLTETLDRRMLSMLGKTDRHGITGQISFNINVRTLLAPEFINFDDGVSASRRGNMVIELQKEDIFSDLSTYLFAREFVQHKGYRICLDGLTYQTMHIIDRERLGCDMAKLIWASELIDAGEELLASIRSMCERAGEKKIILCRCDSREAIDFGKSVGIGLFQGRYVESLIAEDGRRRELLRLKRRIERNTQSDDEEKK